MREKSTWEVEVEDFNAGVTTLLQVCLAEREFLQVVTVWSQGKVLSHGWQFVVLVLLVLVEFSGLCYNSAMMVG